MLAAPVAYTESELAAKIATLEAQLTSTVESVTFADRAQKNRAISEITSQIAYWQNKLARFQARPKQFFGVSAKGLS